MSRKELIELKINTTKVDIEEAKGKMQFHMEESEKLEIELKNLRKELRQLYEDLRNTLN